MDDRAFRAALEKQRQSGFAEPAPDVAPDVTFAEALENGDRLRDAGNPGDAVWSYLKASRLEPESPIPLERLGYLQLRESPDEAQMVFEELAELNPDTLVVHQGMGLVHLARGDNDAARTSFESALTVDPESVHSVMGLGVVEDGAGDHVAAQRYYERALELAPRDPDVLNNLGLSRMAAQNYEGALEAFRAALRAQPKSSTLQNNLGMALARLELYDEAWKVFQDAGSAATAENNLGYAYYINGEYRDAIALYERALQGGTDQPLVVVRNLRDAQEALALEESALDAFSPVPELGLR